LGTQTLGSNNNTPLLQQTFPNPSPPPANLTFSFPNPIELLRLDFSNSQAVLDGVVEITPRPALSARVRGSASVFNADKGMTLESGPVPVISTNLYPPPRNLYGWGELSATLKPQFWLWEVAGLYNLSYEDIYRYSIVAGYRQDSWKYPTSNSQANSPYLSDTFISQIPFLGMQTVMCCPAWKARFEVIGSPFMSKSITHKAQNQGYYMQLDGNLTKGGLLEFQVEGNVNFASIALL
jgi:hypothetical protein